MTPSIARHCPKCKTYSQIDLHPDQKLQCPQCKEPWGQVTTVESILDFCPICQCRQFYKAKDFNQLLGCLVVGFGIILVPFTYGLSLPVFALIDWLIYRQVQEIICCYKCACEFRGIKTTKELMPFMHHIGLKYDKFR